MPGIFKKRFSLVNFETFSFDSWKLSTNRSRHHVSPAIWSSEGCGHSWHSEDFDCQEILLGVGYLRNSRKGYKKMSWSLGPIFQYIKRGDVLNGQFVLLEQRHALTSYETHQIMVAMQSAEFSILQSLLYTSRLNRHVKVNMCSEYLVGGWDRHRKLLKTAQNSHDSEWKKGWHQIVSTIFVNRNQLVSPKHLVEVMLMWHGLSTVNFGAERLLAEDFARCKCFLSRSSLLWGRIRLAKVILITQIEQKTVRSKRSKAMKSPCQWNSCNESWGHPTHMSIWKLIVHAAQSWTFPSNSQSVVKWRLPWFKTIQKRIN